MHSLPDTMFMSGGGFVKTLVFPQQATPSFGDIVRGPLALGALVSCEWTDSSPVSVDVVARMSPCAG